MIAYKYRSGRGLKDGEGNEIFERDIKLLSQDTIYIPTISQLNDPAEALVDDSLYKEWLDLYKIFLSKEMVSRVEESVQSLFDKIRLSGIYSLSKEIDNELLWAYYASGHTGYAIVFDTEVLSKSFKYGKWVGMFEIDVKYSSKLPRFDISVIDKQTMNDALSCLVGNKSNSWEHEAEHRLIFEEGGKCVKIDYRAIKGFVFGCRMKEDDIDYVMKTFSGRDFEYFKVVLKDDSYRLSIKRLNDKYPTLEKYCPNKVEYSIEDLLEGDRYCGGVGYKYTFYVEEALREVSREPFVTAISHIVVSDDQKYPRILIWTKVKQDGSIKSCRSYEYEVIESSLVKKV